ncbi:MAG: DUF1801 domain-containing protein [Flavobacteriaceae bacterium]|nr:DUF1801 domain-containing protein [Flavobacteriaceae bacterium]
MKIAANSVQEYLENIPDDRKESFLKLFETIQKNIPEGFEPEMSYGMIGWVVPHRLYPAGYHCKPELPLPFLSIANQKNFIAIYHMGIYANKELYDWFTESYASQVKTKLDMGKSCIRFKKPDQIPFELIGELATKMTPENWIDVYEKAFRSK